MPAPSPPADVDGPPAAAAPASRRWVGPVLLGVAVAWMVGALGYVVGVRTSEPAFGAADRGFVVDMSDHHDQAVLLAQHELDNGSDPVLELMQQHHAGGAHMADDAAERAESPELRALAARMARNQRIEVSEYQRVLDRLDATT